MGVDYYGVLGIERTAGPAEVRRGYARTALRCHPERPYPECPPDDLDVRTEWFRLAGEAFEVLSEPGLRAAYDKFGEAGLKNGVPARDPDLFLPPYAYHDDPMKTYWKFFGTDSPSEPLLLAWQSQFESRRPDGAAGPWFRERPEEVVLPLTLEQVLQGGAAEATMTRREMHHGVLELREHRLGLELRPGTPSGSAFLFAEQGHQAPFSVPGDVLVVTRDLPHPTFSREKHHDLVVRCRVDLTEALLGCSLQVPTLDGRLLRINVTDVITPDYELRIPGEGLPKCPKSEPPAPWEPPQRRCYLRVPGWAKDGVEGRAGPCASCGQTSDACDLHEDSQAKTPEFEASEVEAPEEGRGSVSGRHASFDRREVEDARLELLRRFPNLVDGGDEGRGDLVVRFQIDFPAHVPGHRRQQLRGALKGLVDAPEHRIIFNRKY